MRPTLRFFKCRRTNTRSDLMMKSRPLCETSPIMSSCRHVGEMYPSTPSNCVAEALFSDVDPSDSDLGSSGEVIIDSTMTP